MRRLVVCGLLLLFGLLRGALATDYDLTIDPGSRDMLKEHSLTIYQPFNLVKKGDRIVSITVAKLPTPNIPCRIWSGVGSNSVVLDDKDTLRNFHGEIRLGSGDPGTSASGAALLMHVIPPPISSERGNLLQNASGILGGHILYLVIPCLLIAIGVAVALFRQRAPTAGAAPLYGKRAYEENVREVKERLERIMEAQEILVRKPPVLRTFRKQIDRFDKRLEKLEVTSVSSQQALSVIASSVVELQKDLDSLSVRNDSAKSAIDELHARLSGQADEGRKSTASIKDDIRTQASQLRDSVAEINSQFEQQSERVAALGKALNEDMRSQAEGFKGATQELGAKLDSQSAKNDSVTSSIAAAFAKVQERFVESEKTLAGLGAALSAEEQANVERAEQIHQTFDAIMAQFQGLSPLPANVSELHGRVGNLKSDLTAISEKLVASNAEMGDFQRSSHLSFNELEEKVAFLKGVLEQLTSELSSLQSDVDVSKSVGETASAIIAEVAKKVDTVRETAATQAQVSKLQSELDASRTIGQANSAVLESVSKAVESVKASAATNEQLAKVQAEIDASKNVGEANSVALAGVAKSMDTMRESVDATRVLGEGASAALADMAKSVDTVRESVNLSKTLGEGNSAKLAEVAKSVDSVREASATRVQVEKLAQVPASIDALKAALSAFDSRLVEIALSKEDAQRILKAHEKLGAMPGDVSQSIQRALEQKFTALMAQSLTLKKGKESEGSGISDRGATALADVAQQLLSEIEHQKSLEGKLAEVLAKIEAVPVALEQIDGKLAQASATSESQAVPIEQMRTMIVETIDDCLSRAPAPASAEAPGVPVEQMMSLIATTIDDRLSRMPVSAEGTGVPVDQMMKMISEAIDDRMSKAPVSVSAEGPAFPIEQMVSMIAETIDDRLSRASATASNESNPAQVEQMMNLIAETKDAVSTVPARIEGIEKGLDEASAKWNAASDRLEQAAQKVIDIANSPRPTVVQTELPAARPAEAVKAESEKAKEPTVPSISSEPSAPAREVLKPTPALKLEETPTPAVFEPEQEIVEVVTPAAAAQEPAKKTAAYKRSKSEEWVAATGNLRGRFATETPKEMALLPDPDAVKRPLTPTETPGIEYPIGPMLCAHNKVIYAHGDSIRAFWPGGNERSILLSYTVPEESWRLLMLNDRLFCAQEKRVEIVETSNWTKLGFFAGDFIGQSGFDEVWGGVRAGSNPVFEFKDMHGEGIGEPISLEKHYSDILPPLSDGKSILTPSRSGQVMRFVPGKSELFCDLEAGKQGLAHFLLTEQGAIAIVCSEGELSIKKLDAKGKVSNSAPHNSKLTSGNVVALGDRLYFFDPDTSDLAVFDIEEMKLVKSIPLLNVQRVRRMVGFGSAQSEILMIAGSDAGGKLGTVFLLDPESEKQVMLCSTNQPHVDAIFGAGHAVVATSSSYQNIIRVFEPFANAEEAGRAA